MKPKGQHFLVILFLCSTGTLSAQDKISKLTAPSSPASSILGLQPTTVLSPKSYQAFEAAVFSNFYNQGTGSITIPNDFALEFTPYWAKDRSLSLEEYLFPKSHWDEIVRNSSISVASTQHFLLGDSTSTNGLSWGYRTTIYFPGQQNRAAINAQINQLNDFQMLNTDLKSAIKFLLREPHTSNGKPLTKAAFLDTMNSFLRTEVAGSPAWKNSTPKEIDAYLKSLSEGTDDLPELDTNDTKPFQDAYLALMARKNDKKSTVFQALQSEVKDRNGLTIDFAYAGILNFPTNNFGFSILPAQSGWITPSYRFRNKADFLKVIGVVRYDWFNIDYYKQYFPQNTVYRSNWNLGVAVSANFNKFTCQFEAVWRESSSLIPAATDADGNVLYKKQNHSDAQYIGSFSYRLTDGIVLSYSLGNRFNPILNPGNTLVSLLSLNFGVGGPKKSDIDLTK